MNEPPALGIEAVEWFAEGGENLTVRVTGRWRRRPVASGQPVLVIEAPDQRHRFPAMPEPPSLTGTVPGTWRISFSVPQSLAPYLSGRIGLQFGAVVVPLPVAVDPVGSLPGAELASAATEAEGTKGEWPVDPALLAARRLRTAELAAQTARRRVAEAEDAAARLAARIEEFEQQLVQARQESERLTGLLAGRDQDRRAAEQLAHAERSLRLEVEDELATRGREQEGASRQTREALAASEDRVRELVREIGRLRRRADEADQTAAAAHAERERSRRREAERAEAERVEAERVAERVEAERLEAERVEAERLEAERVEAERQPSGEPAVGLAQGMTIAETRSLQGERELVARYVAAALRIPSEPPRPPMPGLPPTEGAPAPATTTAAVPQRSQFDALLQQTLEEMRDELRGLRVATEHERAGRAAAELRAAELERELLAQRGRSERAYDAIEELRGAFDALRPVHAVPGGAAPGTVGPVEPGRLAEALSRLQVAAVASELREEGLGIDEAPLDARPHPAAGEPPRKPWMDRVFRALVRQDAATAGRLLLDLLPAHWSAHPHPVAYDILLRDEARCVQVTVRAGTTEIDSQDAARSRGDVNFQLTGDLASVARLLTAGTLRRRFGRRVARVKGDRKALRAITALVRGPLRLHDLHAAGARIEPVRALRVVALMIDPAWTAGERFTIAHQEARAPALDTLGLGAPPAEAPPAGAPPAGAPPAAAPPAGAPPRGAPPHAGGTPPGAAGAFLQVRDGGPLTVTDTALPGPVTATIVCSADALLALLAGERPPEVEVRGQERVLALLLDWVKRAQSG